MLVFECRFEDQVSSSDELGGFCLGFVLESLQLRPGCLNGGDCGEESAREGGGGLLDLCMIRDLFQSAQTLQQKCDINGCAVYCNELSMTSRNPCCVPFVGKSSKEIGQLMTSTLSKHWRVTSSLPPGQHAYVIQPHDYSLKFGLNFANGDVHVGIEILSKNITCDVEDAQLKNVTSFIHFTDVYLSANQYSDLRPDKSLARGRRCRDPAAWWKFAVLAVRRQLGHCKHLRMSPASVDRHFKDKLVYTGS